MQFDLAKISDTTLQEENVIKLARDVDLLENKTGFVITIVRIERLTESNYGRLTSTALGGDKGFPFAVSAFGCDVCHCEASTQNPIWTNAEHRGVDVCDTCVKKAYAKGWVPLPGWKPGPVYSLAALVTLVR